MAVNLDYAFTNSSDIAISETGWIVFSLQTVDTLAGDDTVSGKGDDRGININGGTLNTGTGDDEIIGDGYSWGIYNYGTINTGAGKDKVLGNGTAAGIINHGIIGTGKGADTITGTRILNHGVINTGKGHDTIVGRIDNFGTINTGAGNDKIDALNGSFSTGKLFLGPGEDTLKGYIGGYVGQYYGGAGEDKILLDAGSYKVIGTSIISGYFTMNVYEFEQIGGAGGGLFAFRDGTLTVDSSGIGTFA